jgi:hypothetical protein
MLRDPTHHTASHENFAAAQNLGGKVRGQTSVENFCGKLRQKTYAEKFCGKLGRSVKSMHHTICDRTKADVEISAPGKIFAPAKLSRLSKPLRLPKVRRKSSVPIKSWAEKSCAFLLFGLGRISNCLLPPSLAEELSFRSS